MCVLFDQHRHFYIALCIVKHYICHVCKTKCSFLKLFIIFLRYFHVHGVLFLHSDCLFLKLKNSLLDLYFGLIARLLQWGQTAALFGAAGHGPVCFLSTVEFIWARGYKHMNGPQCAGSVLTSPHQCAWDTLIKTGTHHGPSIFQREPRPPLKDQSVLIWTMDRFVWLICATLS